MLICSNADAQLLDNALDPFVTVETSGRSIDIKDRIDGSEEL